MNGNRFELADGVVTLRPMPLTSITDWVERGRISWATGGPVRSFSIREVVGDR